MSEVEGEEGLICRRGRRTDKRTLQGVNGEVCQPHPILSKLLHFSSSDSSNSSFGLHSAHSEEVFSEGEDTQDYRQNTNRKVGYYDLILLPMEKLCLPNLWSRRFALA